VTKAITAKEIADAIRASGASMTAVVAALNEKAEAETRKSRNRS
jgi:hypothetical protein